MTTTLGGPARHNRLIDGATKLNEGTISSSGPGQVGGSDAYLDLGDVLGSSVTEGATIRADIFLQVTSTFGTATDDVTVHAEGSQDAAFTTTVPLGGLRFGNTAALPGNMGTTPAGQYTLSFVNDQYQTAWRYLRLYVEVASGDITFEAWMTKQ